MDPAMTYAQAPKRRLGPWKIVLAMVGVIGLLLVPRFVWATGLGLDGVTTLRGVLFAYGFMLAISLGGSLVFLAPAMAVSRVWRIGVALVLLAYVVPRCLHVVWWARNAFDDDLQLLVVEIGAVPAALGLFFLASSLRRPGVRTDEAPPDWEPRDSVVDQPSLLSEEPPAPASPSTEPPYLPPPTQLVHAGRADMGAEAPFLSPQEVAVLAGVALLAGAILALAFLWIVGGSGPSAYKQIGPPLRNNCDAPCGIGFSPNGRLLASSDARGRPLIWDLRTHRVLGKPFPCVSEPVFFSPDGRLACDAGYNSPARWRVEVPGKPFPCADPVFIPDGRLACKAGNDSPERWRVAVWNPGPRPARRLVTAFGGSGLLSQMAFSPDGRLLATQDDNDTVRVWNLRTHHEVGKPLSVNCTDPGQPMVTCEDSASLAFSPDGRIVATATAYAIRLFDARTHQQIGNDLVTPSAEDLAGYSFAFQQHGHLLASVDFCGIAEGCNDMKFTLWDVRTQKQVGPALLSCSEPTGLTFRSDGRVLATACGNEIRFWDVRSHKQLGKPLEVSGLTDLAFSPNGRILATTTGNTVRLWNVAAVGRSVKRG